MKEIEGYFTPTPSDEKILLLTEATEGEEEPDHEEDLVIMRRYLRTLHGQGVPIRLRRQARRYAVRDGLLFRCTPQGMRLIPGIGSRKRLM